MDDGGSWQGWETGRDFGNKTLSAHLARPYKLGCRYVFVLLQDHDNKTIGTLIDASHRELVIEITQRDKPTRQLIVGRAAVKTAVETTSIEEES